MPTSDCDRNQRTDYEFDHPWPWQVKENCKELLADGRDPGEMAEIFGCVISTVYRYLNRHDLEGGEAA